MTTSLNKAHGDIERRWQVTHTLQEVKRNDTRGFRRPQLMDKHTLHSFLRRIGVDEVLRRGADNV